MDKKLTMLMAGIAMSAAFSSANGQATPTHLQLAANSSSETTTKSSTKKLSVIEQLEEEREQKLEENRNKAEQEKAANRKEATPECQFWRLQKTKKPTEKVDAKINQHCGIPATQH